MYNFVTFVSYLVFMKCRIAIFIGEIDISLLKSHVQQIEAEKLKKYERESKRARNGQFEYSSQKSRRKNYSLFMRNSSAPKRPQLVPSFQNYARTLG